MTDTVSADPELNSTLSLFELPVNHNYVVLVLSNHPLHFYYILSMHVCMQQSDNNLQLILILPHGSQGLNWVGGKHLYPLIHLLGS